ncbi:lipopolysaccharide biosynthesis protein [Phocaeicola coprophilus]|uniref:lipopolysaccharide biosynthesis protein n=1 Tax=Phocaeicola coprophilus TaxID=387090 RepID=UPI0026722AA3|nr:oligosaccharide flippase family protein [Phocaeicola coprophilus]
MTDSKKIAKNTLLLYFRMLLTIIVGLYTSRVILNVLGISDYGIYNVVGGVVSMLSFLNAAMTGASQRFIAFELGKNDKKQLNRVFCTSVLIHFALAGIVLIIAETIGLWFLNTHLNISPDRMVAANWVYQCSVFTFLLTIVSVPYNSCIVAHEHIKTFAYVSILEVSLKLLIVYLLLIIPKDKLITYSLLILGVAIIIRLIYGIYCKRHFEECTFRYVYDRKLFNSMFSFAGWNTLGNLGFSVKDQGANIILNLFFGTTINAARGIALQVNGIINNFSQNFLMALNPQITKQYASNNIQQSVDLVYAGCRFSFYLLMLISIPFILHKDYLLFLWLKNVPEYTDLFLQFTLMAAIVEVMSNPLTTALQATGKIRNVQLTVCIIMLCELPAAYLILKTGGEPYMTMYPTLVTALLKLFFRFYFLKREVLIYRLKYFLFSIVLRNLFIAIISYCISYKLVSYFSINFISFIASTLLITLINIFLIYLLGLSAKEKNIIKNKLYLLCNK